MPVLFYEYKTPFDFNTSLAIYFSNDTSTIVSDKNKFKFDRQQNSKTCKIGQHSSELINLITNQPKDIP